jgi:hypothetical protein
MYGLWGWLLGRPSHGAYYVNRYAPWTLGAVSKYGKYGKYAVAGYLVYRLARRRRK